MAMPASAKPLALLIVLLSVLTALLGTVDRFEPSGPNLLANSSEIQSVDGWAIHPADAKVMARDGALVLSLHPPCTDNYCRASATQNVSSDGKPTYVRFAATVTWQNVDIPANGRLRGPRLHLGSKKPTSRWTWHPAFHEMRLSGTGTMAVAQDFYVDSQLPIWGAWIHLAAKTGTMSAGDLTLRRMTIKPWWQLSFGALTIGWTAAIGCLLWPSLLLARRRLAHAGVVLAATGILVGTLAPDTALNPVRDAISAVGSTPQTKAPKTTPPKEARAKPKPKAPNKAVPANGRQHIDKLAHFAAFAMLGLCSLFAFKRQPPHRLLLVLVALTPVSELLQSLTLARTPRLVDALIDSAGLMLAAVLWWLISAGGRTHRDKAAP